MENVNRNSFACYWKGNTIVGKYNLNGKVSDAQTVTETGPDGTSRTGCRFDPPTNAKNFVATIVGGGGGGAFFGKGNDVDTLMAKVTIGLGTAFGIITLALAKING